METNIPICLNSKVNGKQPSLQDRVYSVDGVYPAVTTCFLPNIAEPRVIQVGNIYPDTDKFKNRTMGRVYDAEGIAPTINTCGGGGREPKVVIGEVTSDNLLELVQVGLVRIRKITPTEAFRLMDLEDKDIDTLLSSGLANTALYQLAGNSIAIGCLYHLFRKMFCETENESEQLSLF